MNESKPHKNFSTTGEFYKDIAMSVDAAISVIEVVADNEFRYRYFNNAFEDLVGLNTGDIVGRTPQEIVDLVGSAIASLTLQDFTECLQAKVLFLREHQVSWQGKNRWFLRHLSPVQDKNGKVLYLVNYILDTTDLREAQSEVVDKKRQLEQKNIALQEVIAQIEQEKMKIKDNVIASIDYILMPIVEKIKLKGDSKKYIQLLKQSLNDMTGSFGKKMSAETANLTSREIEVCNMVKNGLTNKEISSLLNISRPTVERHRANIRRKFGLVHGDANLKTYLRTI